jgi:hypothetical protein
VLSLGLDFLTGPLFPEVENPWPDTIGLEFPFGLAAAFAVVAGVVNPGGSKLDRDRAINWAGVAGFLLGIAIYLIALASQIVSSI